MAHVSVAARVYLSHLNVIRLEKLPKVASFKVIVPHQEDGSSPDALLQLADYDAKIPAILDEEHFVLRVIADFLKPTAALFCLRAYPGCLPEPASERPEVSFGSHPQN